MSPFAAVLFVTLVLQVPLAAEVPLTTGTQLSIHEPLGSMRLLSLQAESFRSERSELWRQGTALRMAFASPCKRKPRWSEFPAEFTRTIR